MKPKSFTILVQTQRRKQLFSEEKKKVPSKVFIKIAAL